MKNQTEYIYQMEIVYQYLDLNLISWPMTFQRSMKYRNPLFFSSIKFDLLFYLWKWLTSCLLFLAFPRQQKWERKFRIFKYTSDFFDSHCRFSSPIFMRSMHILNWQRTNIVSAMKCWKSIFDFYKRWLLCHKCWIHYVCYDSAIKNLLMFIN